MVEPIAKPIGLFKAGPSGAGGQLEPMMRIRRDIFQRTQMIFGLEMNKSDLAPTKDTMLIDVIYDGYTNEEPQSARPMIFVTNYQDQTDRGAWFGWFAAPNWQSRYSAIGKHTVTVKVAPRAPPANGTTSANQVLPERDFSWEAGGVIGTFEFEIYPTTDPIDGIQAPDE